MSGELYRAKMRIIHRFGWCWPQSVAVEPGYVWCHWCGMRGSKPISDEIRRHSDHTSEICWCGAGPKAYAWEDDAMISSEPPNLGVDNRSQNL